MIVNEIDAIELEQRLASKDAPQLLDIRGEAELAQGIIPGAEHIAMHLLPLRCDELDTSRDIVLYCHSGARSYQACGFLAQRGISNAFNLRGGIVAWARSGLPIETS